VSPKKKNSNKTPKKAGAESSRPDGDAAAHKSAATLSALNDALIGIGVCLLFFVALEVTLRVAGVPASKGPEADPFVGFSAIQPLFRATNGVASVAPERLKYFNEASFPVKRGPTTTRVFCFGGSTTYGHPFDGRTAFARWLEELLKASDPGRNAEVINAGGISYASYRIVPLVREALQYNPDFIVMYTGHNEFLERRTYSALFDQGRTLVTFRSLLSRLHLYRGLEALLEPLTSRFFGRGRGAEGKGAAETPKAADVDSSPPTPGKTILGAEVKAVLDQSGGIDLYHRDDDFSAGVVQHFGHNLRSILSMCKNAGVAVIMVEPESNLKDFSPFKSEHPTEMSREQKARFQAELGRCAQLARDGMFQQALSAADEAIRLDPLYAHAHFWKGKALLGLGRIEDSSASFVRAKDLDVCPLRAITPILDQIRTVAREENTVLIDFKHVLKEIWSDGRNPTGIPGDESFLDHVHPAIEGHQRLAEHILAAAKEKGLVKPSKNLTREDCDAIYARVMQTFDPSFFAARDLNLAKTLKWAGKKEEAAAALERAASKLQNNAEIHKMLGSLLIEQGRVEEGVSEYEKAADLSGREPTMMYDLAAAYYAAGRKTKAVETYSLLAREGAQVPEAYSNLAMIYLREGKHQEARDVLEQGVKNTPGAPAVMAAMGLTIAVSGRPEEAIAWMLKAIEAAPDNPDQLYNLAGMYALTGRKSQAIECLRRAVSKGYARADNLASDPAFDSIRREPGFNEILNRLRAAQ
jgi:Flp pilus assembly protein TadD